MKINDYIKELDAKIARLSNELAYLKYRKQQLEKPGFTIAIYKKFQDKIQFHGVQFDHETPYGFLFSDRETGSSFMIDYDEENVEQAILNRLKALRIAFKEAKNVANQTK